MTNQQIQYFSSTSTVITVACIKIKKVPTLLYTWIGIENAID